jgi:hypothetical protein
MLDGPHPLLQSLLFQGLLLLKIRILLVQVLLHRFSFVAEAGPALPR